MRTLPDNFEDDDFEVDDVEHAPKEGGDAEYSGDNYCVENDGDVELDHDLVIKNFSA